MVDPTTVNKFLAQPTRGSDVGVWDTPVNANMGIIDNSFGGVATIALTNSPVTLSSGQYQCTFIRFTGAITANIIITFPAIGSFYTIINDITNSSNFTLTMQTTAVASRLIGLPPGSMTQVMTDGANCRFSTLPPVGTYWDYAGSSVPAWVSACSVPPYLNCTGGSFSSGAYPTLTALFGGTTLPDLRGRYRAYLNQGTGRITTAAGGIDGDTFLASGGTQSVTLSSQNLPNISFPVTDPGHTHALTNGTNILAYSAGVGPQGINPGINAPIQTITVNSNTTGISVNSGGSGTAAQTLPPAQISGITMIRAG
jgi:hypothetical protein